MPVEQRFPDGVPSGVEGMPPVVVATGQQTLYFTGQIALDNDGRLVGDTIEEQTVQVFRNLEAAAVAVGVTASDIAHLRFHIVTDDFQHPNTASTSEYRGDDHAPGAAPHRRAVRHEGCPAVSPGSRPVPGSCASPRREAGDWIGADGNVVQAAHVTPRS